MRAQSSCERESTGLCAHSPVANGNQLGCVCTVQLRTGINWVVRAQFSCERESTGLCAHSPVANGNQLSCACTVQLIRSIDWTVRAQLERCGQRSNCATYLRDTVDSDRTRARPARTPSTVLACGRPEKNRREDETGGETPRWKSHRRGDHIGRGARVGSLRERIQNGSP